MAPHIESNFTLDSLETKNTELKELTEFNRDLEYFIDQVCEMDKIIFKELSWSKQEYRYNLFNLKLNYYFTLKLINKQLFKDILAYGGYHIIQNELIYNKFIKIAEITSIATNFKLRKLKIGSYFLINLINHAIQFNNIETFTLNVVQTNLIAINLYKSFGFKFYSLIKNYYNQDDENNKRIEYFKENAIKESKLNSIKMILTNVHIEKVKYNLNKIKVKMESNLYNKLNDKLN